MNSNRNLRGNRKNRNCLQSLKVVTWNKVSGAIAISKASWGCAPALPNRIRVVFLEELLLEETVFSVRQKGVPPLLLPASVLQLPRCLVRICNLFHRNNQVANWQVSRNAIAAGKTCCKYNLLRKCGLLAHTSAAFLKNCCTEKLFICLRLVLAKIMAFFTTFTQFSLTPISRNVIILMFIERTNFDEPSNKIAIFNRRNFYEKRF